MKMTPQQKAPSKDLGSWIQEGGKKMRATVQRRHTASAISKALSKNKLQPSDNTPFPSHHDNGLHLEAFCSSKNMFILKERIQLSSGWHTQERHLLLFSDSLIIAKSKSSSTMKVKKQVPLSEVWISSNFEDVSEKKHSVDDSFVIGWPTTSYVVTFSSPDTKEKWLSALNWHISEVKKDEYPMALLINVSYVDADEYISNTTVSVSNMDTAEKVSQAVSQQLGLPGRSGDYHLWVMSAKDESPYPLFGHEYLYSIAMNSLRESIDIPRRSNNNLLLEPSTDGFNQQLPYESQCQFIIKLRPQSSLDLKKEYAQKQCRRKKSLIDWALRRSGSTTLSTPSSPSPLTSRKLFGHCLSSVCRNGNLPKPIMDMLLLLYEEGPNTKGIFRRSANAKTCKELKEKLMSGNDVQMEGESVFVAASVIMDFLRNIPDSILSSDMYGLWMEATESDEFEYKIKVIKSLLDQLPEANFSLLQHLFAVLNHIEKSSEENQMTALNLALCIAPTMLWLPTVSDPEEESKSTKKVALLVQFLIENYQLIFEQDAALLFSKYIQQGSGSTNDLSDMRIKGWQNSSEQLEFTASDLGKSEPDLLKDEIEMFDESLLLEDGEDWDLFSEIAACYQSKTKMNILECYSTNPTNCRNSACCLSCSRDRCSSEPSVCQSSRIPVQGHEPVARQSSCDATIIHSQIDCINQMKQLQLDSQKLLHDNQTASFKSSKYAFWKSAQTRANIEKSSSKKSSVSSLYSTATSPSVSSLSSLDSAFSYCSESSVFSPSNVTSLPFMFGTSARLHTLCPEITKDKLREWQIPLSTLFGTSSCDLDAWEMQWESKDYTNVRLTEKVDNEVLIQGNVHKECLDKEFIPHCSNSVKDKESYASLQQTSFEEKHVNGQSVSENEYCAHKETSVKNVTIKSPDVSFDDGLQRTNVTFYMSPNIMPIHHLNDQKLNEDSCSLSAQVTKIPHTVFYGQNAPLVVHSISRKQHPDIANPQWQTQLKHVINKGSVDEIISNSGKLSSVFVNSDINSKQDLPQEKEAPETDKSIGKPLHVKGHTKSITSFTQTMRFILPSSVKNTVQERLKYDPKSVSSPHGIVLDSDVSQGKYKKCNIQSAESPAEREGENCVIEESFV